MNQRLTKLPPEPQPAHTRGCVAEGCRTNVRPDRLMCRKHWALAPAYLRGLIRQSIAVLQARPAGRRDNALESTAATRAELAQLTKLAIAAVAEAEGRMPFVV